MPIRLPSSAAGAPTADAWKALKPRKPEFDFVIIGGGSAGYAAARTGAALGLRTALIEGAREMGGLCILRGCMPSKAFLESSHRWHDAGRAAEFGFSVRPIGVDMGRIQTRKQRLVGDFASYRRKQLLSGKFTLIRGFASFLDAETVLVQRGAVRELVRGATFLIATGSVISRPPVPGLWETGCLTSDDALEATTIPKSLAVLGGGVIAVELGQFFSRIGSRTTLIQRSPRIVKGYDEDVSAELERALKNENLDVITGSTLVEVRRAGKKKKVVFLRGKRRRELVVDEILCALGREPAIEKLGLENAGLTPKNGKLSVDDTLVTAVPHIFGAGDVVGLHDVVHIAIQQAEAAARNAARLVRGRGEPFEKMDYRLKALVTFTDPEIALVGLTEAEARARGIDFLTASYPFNDHGKAQIMGAEYGFVKLMAEKSRGEIVGAEIIGPHASDLIHELIAVMRYRGTVQELALMPHYHPTLAEIITYPAEELADRLATI